MGLNLVLWYSLLPNRVSLTIMKVLMKFLLSNFLNQVHLDANDARHILIRSFSLLKRARKLIVTCVSSKMMSPHIISVVLTNIHLG